MTFEYLGEELGVGITDSKADLRYFFVCGFKKILGLSKSFVEEVILKRCAEILAELQGYGRGRITQLF